MNTEEKEPKVNLFLLGLAITAYSVISISIVYFNHWFFTSGFKYPVFISWWQQAIGAFFFFIFALSAKKCTFMKGAFPIYRIDKKLAFELFPLSFTFVLCIAASNLCLKFSLVSTYLVARSCTLLFVLFLSYVMLKKKENLFVVISCFTMAAGFLINSLDPTTLSFFGLLYGVISSLFQASYNVNIKKYLSKVDNDSQKLLYYNMVLSSVLYIPVVLVLEGLSPFKDAFGIQNNLLFIWSGILMSGLLSTSMNMFQYLVMNITNPVATNIVGLTKSLFQTMGGFIFYNDPITINSISGITLSMLGSAMYCTSKIIDYLDVQKQAKRKAMMPEAEIKV